jgi:hypothetical protein
MNILDNYFKLLGLYLLSCIAGLITNAIPNKSNIFAYMCMMALFYLMTIIEIKRKLEDFK